MALTALQPQPEPKATPRSTEWCEIVQRHPLANDGLAQLRASVFSQDYQIRVRIKIRDFEAQEFASLAARPESGPGAKWLKGLEPITSSNAF
jgi:hypothetical protein